MSNFLGSFSGSEWLNVLKRTKDNWFDEISGLAEDEIKNDVIFLHIGLFWDGFQKYRNTKSSSAGVLMATLLEVNPSLRWRPELNAIAPLFFVCPKKTTAESMNRQILPLYTEQLRDLASGIEMYCEPLGRTIKVFAFVTEILGDHPGRAAFGTIKSFAVIT